MDQAFVFPAGDPDVRRTIAIHRLTDADPPRTWSVDVNRPRVNAGNIAFLWQTGGDADLWRPGIWAAGVVWRFDRENRPHWRDADRVTQYADLELQWIPIVDRSAIREDAAGNGPMKDSVLGVNRQQMRSPVLLRQVERDWLLQQVPARTRKWIEEMSARASGRS
jgi:hypothetical protein